jgi:hypothetical protein
LQRNLITVFSTVNTLARFFFADRPRPDRRRAARIPPMHVAAARRCRQHAQRTIEKAHETSCFIQAHRNASATAAMRDLRDGHVTCDERKAQEDHRSTSPGGVFPALHKPECAKLRKK